MVASAFAGSVAANTGSATTTVSGLAFRPKVVIFTATGSTFTTWASLDTGGCISRGFSDGTTHRATAWAGDTAVATSNVGRAFSETKCIVLLNDGTPNVANEATCAMTADGFTLTWNTVPGGAILIGYEAFGGTDITNVAIGTATMPTTITTLDTNVGFVGSFAMFLSGTMTTPGALTSSNMSWGWAQSSTAECAGSISVADAQTMSANVNATSWTRSDACLIGTIGFSGLADFVADFVTFDQGAAGTTFRLNFSDAPPAAYLFAYLVIKGGSWGVGVSARPTTAIAQTVSSLAFTPNIVGFGATQAVTLNTLTVEAVSSFSAAHGVSNEFAMANYHNDVINTVVNQRNSTANVAVRELSATTAVADFTSFNANGWTITWTGAGTPAIQMMWYAAKVDDNPVALRPQARIIRQAVHRATLR